MYQTINGFFPAGLSIDVNIIRVSSVYQCDCIFLDKVEPINVGAVHTALSGSPVPRSCLRE